MIALEHSALLLIGVLIAAWTLAAAVAIVVALLRVRRGKAARARAGRLARMLDESPAIPLLVRADGRIEAPQRLAQWLGLDAVPSFLTELAGGGTGLPAEQLDELTAAVRRAQKTGAPFRMVLAPLGSRRSLALRGHLADPQISPGGAAMVWVFDFSDSEGELMQLRRDAARASKDFAALVALIEAAPLPMWFRAPDGHLQLVNAAYVDAVGAGSAARAAAEGIELVETVDGETPAQVALRAAAATRPIERQVSVTIAGQRRAFRVKDLPLRDEGIAGYAIDIEELEELSRTFEAFRRAQRSMLDHLSSGVAQFNAERRLIFANRPFQSMFALEQADLWNRPDFEHLLTQACEAGRLPEARDFRQWRQERARWFEAAATVEEAWPLPDGTHLRVVAEPVPDGGLLLIAEDRTEQLRLAALGDTMQRARSATFDSLVESVAVFAPDGRMQLWNRRFAADWALESEFLDTHPHIEAVLAAVCGQLEEPDKAAALGDAVRLATLDRVSVRGRLAMADGRRFEFAGVPLPDGNGLVTVLDVTDAENAEETLRERNATLQAIAADRVQVLAGMLEELRGVSAVIGGLPDRLRRGDGPEMAGERDIAAIRDAVDAIARYAERAIGAPRGEAGEGAAVAVPIDLAAMAAMLVAERRARIAAGALSLDLRTAALAGRQATGDAARLARGIGLLLDHAIASTPAQGRILFELSAADMGGGTRIVVSDNGRGLAMAGEGEALAADPGEPGGGLALVRAIVGEHGGTLELMSEADQGTAAIVALP